MNRRMTQSHSRRGFSAMQVVIALGLSAMVMTGTYEYWDDGNNGGIRGETITALETHFDPTVVGSTGNHGPNLNPGMTGFHGGTRGNREPYTPTTEVPWYEPPVPDFPFCPKAPEPEMKKTTGKWVAGPGFRFEDFQLINASYDIIPPQSGNIYECFTFRFKGKFYGKIECDCEDCETPKIIEWESPSIERTYTACFRKDPILIVSRGSIKAALLAIKWARTAANMKRLIEEYGFMVKPGIRAVQNGLRGSANLIRQGKITLDQLEKWFDEATQPTWPDGMT